MAVCEMRRSFVTALGRVLLPAESTSLALHRAANEGMKYHRQVPYTNPLKRGQARERSKPGAGAV